MARRKMTAEEIKQTTMVVDTRPDTAVNTIVEEVNIIGNEEVAKEIASEVVATKKPRKKRTKKEDSPKEETQSETTKEDARKSKQEDISVGCGAIIPLKKPRVRWIRHSTEAIVPTKSTYNAGFDIYTTEKSCVLYPLETHMFATDISSIIEDGYYFQLFERGSTGSKGIKQSCGVIDTSYSGNWFVPLVNVTEKPIVITSSITYKEVEKLLQNTELTDEQRSKLQEQHDDLKALYEFELEALKDWYDENIVDDFDSLWYLLDHKKAQRDWEEWLKTIVFYPTTKAISQAVLLPCYDVNSKEGTLEELSAREEELKKLGDSRGKGALGSSGK